MESSFIYKYRPTTFQNIHDSILIDIIKLNIKMDMIHAIFVGNYGCGKSTIINVIIKEYYGDLIKDIHTNENILYINNLKEQGISYYRTELKTFCQTPSTIKGKKKILVLDDIDLISEQSQQVFRNCIDKYLNNIHIIASCINIQKVIDSILSRLTVFKMKKITETDLSIIANHVITNENIKIDNDALQYLYSISNHSIRIMLNYLEKFKLVSEPITMKLAIDLCTNISFNDFDNYTKLCKRDNNLYKAIDFIYKLYDKGYSVMDILDNYFEYIKHSKYITEDEKYKIIPLICKYITLFHNLHEDEIELIYFTNHLISLFTENKNDNKK